MSVALPRIGLGAAPLGNLYAPVADADARDTLETALAGGLTYIDTAPYYGFGLSERRVGDTVRGRTDVTISTKAGRLLVPAAADGVRHGFASPMPFEPVFDYTHDGVMRSWEHSLQRLGLARIDILYIHDIGRRTHGDAHERHWRDLTAGGGLKALETLRRSGAIGAIGVGVNEIEICLDLLAETRLDLILLAGRYTLLEQAALDRLFPVCADSGTGVVVGGPYNSGILARGVKRDGEAHYDYAPPSAAIREKVAALEEVCRRHAVPLAAAALQFPLAHPQVVSVIPGLASREQVEETLALRDIAIPAALWQEIRAEGLLHPDAPTPGDKS